MNQTANKFKALFEKARQHFDYFLEGAILGFTEDVVARMGDLKITKSELAKKLNCNPAYVTKVLRGSTNFTLSSMVKIGIALDSELEVRLRPKTVKEDWSGILQTMKTRQTMCPNLLLQWPNNRGIRNYFNQVNRNPIYHDTNSDTSDTILPFSNSARGPSVH
ncbi:MAG: helix-turn-helix transcriptional regulator [Limisphaerales bacterium]